MLLTFYLDRRFAWLLGGGALLGGAGLLWHGL